MGLLLGMTAARLQGLARNWQIEATIEPRTLVSQLYNEMTDEQSVKFRYENLTPRERLTLDRVVDNPKGWVSIRDLEADLPFSDVDLQMVLAELEELGLVTVDSVRVSDGWIVEGRTFSSRSLPSVQQVVVRVAPEICSILRRIKSQMAAGNQSDATLHKLLGGLTFSQLQELASRWRLPYQDHGFKRELIMHLEDTISRRKCVEDLLSELGQDPTTVFRVVCEAGGKVSVDSLRESSGLAERALRLAISSLMSHFLLSETYTDGRRYLFTPSGVARDDEVAHSKEVNAGSEPAKDGQALEPRKIGHGNFAFFFDLLVLTNLLESHDVELAGRDLRLPRWAVNQLKEELAVVAGSGFGPIRLDCLVRVAARLGLIGVRGDRIVATDKVEEWVALGVPGQARALYDLWLEDDCWCSEHRAYPIVLDAGRYRWIRRRLLAVLRRCQPGRWYAVDTITGAIIGNCLELEDVVRVRSAAEQCGDGSYRELVKKVVALSLGTLLYWTGGLSLGFDEGMEPSVISVRGIGEWLFGSRTKSKPTYPNGSLAVLPNFEVMVSGADPEVWRWLLRFAVTVSAGRVSVHQITKRKVQHAVGRGCSAERFIQFLAERCHGGLPQEVVASVLDWAEGAKGGGTARSVILEVEDEAVLDQLMATTKYGKWISQRLSSTRVLVREMADVERLVRDIKSEGFSLRVSYSAR